MSSIELEGVAKSWGDAAALHDVSLRIEPGSFCVLLGPSGCGKSTTLRIIAGLEVASAGRLRIDGRDVTALAPAQRGVAMVFQNYALFPHLSVADNITFGLAVRRVPAAERDARLREAASLLGLEPLLQRKPSQLSGGQQQRVALGRALVARAKVCLMDEPLSNLDAQLRQEMRRELRELQRKLALTVVYVTHDQAEAMSMADQVVLLSQGRVEQNGAPRELYARPQTTFAARFIGTPPMNLIALDAGRIAGSTIDTGLREAATIGIRPEAIALEGDAGAEVRSVEYLGADLVLECAIGSQTMLVRTDGRHRARAGERVGLRWASHDVHAFDAAGRRTP
ncbi:MAG: sn-glycerol-3-phosphate import ATP-binding protein UgpC [Burkholderiaceae bacterium]|nr:sn-glycerol-3-phosphate import ATP-binding protein UgpC [Burkholderiaceae bacterium]